MLIVENDADTSPKAYVPTCKHFRLTNCCSLTEIFTLPVSAFHVNCDYIAVNKHSQPNIPVHTKAIRYEMKLGRSFRLCTYTNIWNMTSRTTSFAPFKRFNKEKNHLFVVGQKNTQVQSAKADKELHIYVIILTKAFSSSTLQVK